MSRKTLKKPVAAIIALFVSTLSMAGGEIPPEPGFPAAIQLPAKARGEAAIAALGKRLPEVAAYYGQSPQRLREVFRADRSLWVDPAGRLLFACELECADCDHAHAEEDDNVAESIGPTDPSPFDTSQAFLLHSRPGANRVIYLDFDGHVDNTPGYWKDGAYAPPYNIPNSDPNTFSTEERNRIIEIWQRVAEDFSMYEINVTTEEPNIEDLRKTSTNDARYGIRVVIGGSGLDWYGTGVGGVAFVGSFNLGNDVPCWVFPAGSGYSAKNVAEAASHEIGHTLGLFHDGIEGGAGYYSGHGNWGPIMGVSYTKPISQWSKGEYANANNTQDDLAVMLTRGAVYRPDDHGGTIGSATELSADSDTASAAGVIERSTDLDFFRIEAAGGQLVVNVAPTPKGANLRLEVKLYDAGGEELQSATSDDTSAGTQPVTLSSAVAAGSYYISVDGIGNGSPETGYSDYGSLGQYNVAISGVVPGGFTWLPVAAGGYQWTSASNWAAGSAPAGATTTARINNDISGNQTIQLTGPTTLGRLFLGDSNNTHAFTLEPAGGSLVFDNSGISSSLSKTTGANDVISAPVSLVGQLDINQSSSGMLEFTGGISGSGSLNKNGAGTLVFGTANSYTGATTITDGLLRLDNANGLPGGIDNAAGSGESTLLFKGGVLGLASGNFTRQLGTGAGQLHWNPSTGGAGSGGFAAFNADREVRLNNGTGAFFPGPRRFSARAAP
jgi:autotransporter-associated beta strand protein